MCELFGMSSDHPWAGGQELNMFRLRGGQAADNSDGWGMAWRENGTFHLFKEPTPAHQSAFFAQLDKNEKWTAFEPGELCVYRSGKLIGRMMTRTTLPSGSERHLQARYKF